MSEYDAVIFDNDGILTYLTDVDVLRRAIRTTFREFGVADPAPEDVEALYGVTVEDLRAVCDDYDIDAERFWRRRDRNAALAQQAEIRAGRKPLYDDASVLGEIDLPVGIVSNNQSATVAYVVEHYDLPDVRVCYGRPPTLEGLRRKKPDPYYLERALSELGADDALYVGDSAKDVVAAERAGVDSAFVRRPHRADLTLPRTPTYEIDGLDEIPALLGGDASGSSSEPQKAV